MREIHLLGGTIEDSAAVHVLALVLGHGLGARLGREDAVVAVSLELRQEVLVELIRLDLLHNTQHLLLAQSHIQLTLSSHTCNTDKILDS